MQDFPILYLTQGSGNSMKPALVAHQLNRTVRIKYIDVLAGETRQAPFLNINPQGVVPYMTLENGKGLGESNAIAWYLAEGSSLVPDNALDRAETIAWMNFEQTALEANISPVRFFTFIAPELGVEHQDMIPVWRERGESGLSRLNDHLSQRDFITAAGYSVADVAVFGYTHLAEEGGFDLGAFPSIQKWIQRVVNQADYLPINELLDGKDSENLKHAA